MKFLGESVGNAGFKHCLESEHRVAKEEIS